MLKNNLLTAVDAHYLAVTKYVALLGGNDNILTIDECATRLRVEVGDATLVNEEELKANGVKAVIFSSGNLIQLVLGIHAHNLKELMQRYTGKTAEPSHHKKISPQELKEMAISYIKMLGGKDNIISFEDHATRLHLQLKDSSLIDENALRANGIIAIIFCHHNKIQLIAEPQIYALKDVLPLLINALHTASSK